MVSQLLIQKNPFYACLSEEAKKRFEQRVIEFVKLKTFVGRDGFILSDEVKIVLAATAIQLTFGLDNYKFKSLQAINIFQDEFYSPLFKASFKGLTSRNGVLSLSWKHFENGFENNSDKLNLGLHEFAHALVIDLHDKNKFNNSFSNYFNTWKKEASVLFFKLRAGDNSFFRSYGATSLQEFFSVCVEHFFEQPQEFCDRYPLLYGHTTILLNQDMCNDAEDFKLKKNCNYLQAASQGTKLLSSGGQSYTAEVHGVEESKFNHFIRTKGLYMAMVMTIIGFIGIPIIFFFASTTVIEIGTLLILLFMCGAIGLLQWKYVKEHIDMAYHQFAMFAFVGFGITLLNLLLLLNSSFIIGTYSKKYDIHRGGYYVPYVIIGEKSNSALERNLNNYINENTRQLDGVEHVTINFNTGLLGFDMIKECEFN